MIVVEAVEDRVFELGGGVVARASVIVVIIATIVARASVLASVTAVVVMDRLNGVLRR